MTPDLLLPRIAAKIAPHENGCWIWIGGRNSHHGYGSVSFGGRSHGAHRLIYELLVGPVPAGLVLDHFFCGRPSCVNPAHLEPVTLTENFQRSPRWNGNKTHCKRGHEFTPDNLVSRSDRRECRRCHNDAELRRFHRLKAPAEGVAS